MLLPKHTLGVKQRQVPLLIPQTAPWSVNHTWVKSVCLGLLRLLVRGFLVQRALTEPLCWKLGWIWR